MENVKEWIKNNYGYGSGSGSGSGSGDGSGDGSGSGDGYGDGYGYGSVSGSGSGDGYGYGDDSVYDSGIKKFHGMEVFLIDGVQTLITFVKDSVAKGFILNKDFTLIPCYVVKGQGYFAHGKTMREARNSLQEKIFENMDADEAIESFMINFKKGEKYKGTEFFEWHHYLTGSCLMGRESFVRNRGIDLEKMYSVDEFIAICENDYGSEIIRELKERWNK